MSVTIATTELSNIVLSTLAERRPDDVTVAMMIDPLRHLYKSMADSMTVSALLHHFINDIEN